MTNSWYNQDKNLRVCLIIALFQIRVMVIVGTEATTLHYYPNILILSQAVTSFRCRYLCTPPRYYTSCQIITLIQTYGYSYSKILITSSLKNSNIAITNQATTTCRILCTHLAPTASCSPGSSVTHQSKVTGFLLRCGIQLISHRLPRAHIYAWVGHR